MDPNNIYATPSSNIEGDKDKRISILRLIIGVILGYFLVDISSSIYWLVLKMFYSISMESFKFSLLSGIFDFISACLVAFICKNGELKSVFILAIYSFVESYFYMEVITIKESFYSLFFFLCMMLGGGLIYFFRNRKPE
ncbi:hypothetical protein [Aliikangiella sp. IMCC44359]|uniref:hypothetical protein n=1 Tax=Aliikangiella sp. IMCC44359 TaxID=3459125 RepID=UPI00403B3840